MIDQYPFKNQSIIMHKYNGNINVFLYWIHETDIEYMNEIDIHTYTGYIGAHFIIDITNTRFVNAYLILNTQIHEIVDSYA